jgi:16S rRNA processing protein RimM
MSTSSSSISPQQPALLEIGRIVRAHGLRGDVAVVLITERSERLDPGSTLQTDRGPLRVERSQLDGTRWLVHFAEITDRDNAESWRGVVLRAEPIRDDDELWVHDLVGCRVVDAQGNDRGPVTEVQSNPASDLLVLESGALVPLTFLVDGPTDGVLRVDVPDGLWDLWT